MKKDFQWAVWLIIAIISILASSCDDQPTFREKAQATRDTKDSIMASTYPYEWDRVVYSMKRTENSDWDTVRTVVLFHEEYIDVNGAILDESATWINKHTFKSNNMVIKITPISMQITVHKMQVPGFEGKETTTYYRK